MLEIEAASRRSRRSDQFAEIVPADQDRHRLRALLTPKDAADFLRVSLSWLAKARMRGDGPPYVKLGRSVRYAETALLQWMRSRQRLSTSQQ